MPLRPLTTLRIGPVARRLITATTAEQIIATVRAFDRAGEQVLILGGGSNVLIADELTDLTVLRLAAPAIEIEGALLRAQAGADWDTVVVRAIEAGLGGLECLSGIPGSAGATPVQNVGAYGVEVADSITRVRLLDRRTGEAGWVQAAELEFGYRHSVLKDSILAGGVLNNPGHAVVLEVEYALDPSGSSAPLRYRELAEALGVTSGERAEPARVRRAVLALRAGKGMVLDADDHDTWSVGSFFTNPVVSAEHAEALQSRAAGPVPHYPANGGVKLAAAWLVEHAGFGKGYGHGPCRLSTKHTLALTNRGAARTADVLALAREVRDGVAETFGVVLQPEPVLVGCAL